MGYAACAASCSDKARLSHSPVVIVVLMIVDDPLPHRRLGVERLAVLVVDHLGSGPTDLRPVLGPASLLGALMSVACSRWRSTAGIDRESPSLLNGYLRTSL